MESMNMHNNEFLNSSVYDIARKETYTYIHHPNVYKKAKAWISISQFLLQLSIFVPQLGKDFGV